MCAGRGFFRTLLPALLLGGALAAAAAVASRARSDRASFTFNNAGEVASLDPHTVSGQPEGRLLKHLYEGLVVKHPKTVEPLPGMASSWSISADGKTYRFHIRSDAVWSNGDPVTASDFEWSFRRILDPSTGSPYSSQLWIVEGAEGFTTGEAGQTDQAWKGVGIRATDKLVLELRLRHPAPYLLDLLSSFPMLPVHRPSLEAAQREYPSEWQAMWMSPRNLVTNGPYVLIERRIGDRIRMAKNPAYWDADRVALDTIDALAVEHVGTGLNLYLTGAVDWIERLPLLVADHLANRPDFQSGLYAATYFYRVNTTRPPFDHPNVRLALAITINRAEICDRILKGGQLPGYSLVPPVFESYYGSSLNVNLDFEQNFTLARALLEAAGYNKDRPFPTIEISYNTSETHRDIAEYIAANWKTALGIDVRLTNQEWKVFLDAQTRLDYQISRSSWIADYADPYSFLSVFTSKSENNKTGWSNPEYDELIQRAAECMDPQLRRDLMSGAERILVDQLPILPIYYYATQNLVSPRLGGFHANRLDDHPPKFFYWKDDEELEDSPGVRPSEVGGPRRGLYPPAGRKTWEHLQ
jgi:oligopeptide transport system substrate-binding protein